MEFSLKLSGDVKYLSEDRVKDVQQPKSKGKTEGDAFLQDMPEF